MGGEGILLSGEAMHKGSIIQDRNGDLEGRNDSRDLTSVVDSVAQDCEECELPLIQGLPGFLSTHANAGGKGEGEKVFIRRWKCGRHNRRAVVLQNIVEDRQQASALEAKFQAEIFCLWDEVGLSEPRKKHPSGLVGGTHLGFCDGYCDNWGNATGGRHSE